MSSVKVVVLNLIICVLVDSKSTSSDSRIVDGKKAYIFEFPYQCSLQKLGNHACGCSLHTPFTCITAAHCVDGATPTDIKHWKVRCGTEIWDEGGILQPIKSITSHPDYKQSSMANDIALLILEKPMPLSKKIQTISLATEEVKDGTEVIVSGWGYKEQGAGEMQEHLHSAELSLLTTKTCSSKKYKYLSEVFKPMICAEGNGKDACQGDSGGPLVFSSTRHLAGVVSWGNGCADLNYPGIYTNVQDLKSWIEKESKKM